MMKLEELLAACEGDGVVSLRLPGPPGRGYTQRLFRTFGPRGRVLCTKPDGSSVVQFDRASTRRYLRRMVEAKRMSEPTKETT